MKKGTDLQNKAFLHAEGYTAREQFIFFFSAVRNPSQLLTVFCLSGITRAGDNWETTKPQPGFISRSIRAVDETDHLLIR